MKKSFWQILITVIVLGFFLLPNIVQAIEIPNPLKYNTFEELIRAIIDALWVLALVITPLVIIVAGFYFITAAGKPEQIATAKNIILYALVGLLIIGMAKGIIELIKEVFKVRA